MGFGNFLPPGVENDRFKIHENCKVNRRLDRDALGHKEKFSSHLGGVQVELQMRHAS